MALIADTLKTPSTLVKRRYKHQKQSSEGELCYPITLRREQLKQKTSSKCRCCLSTFASPLPSLLIVPNMSNNTCSQSILVSLGSAAPAVSHLKAELEQYWNSSKSVPTYKLQPVSDTSTSDVEKLLASSKLKAVINTVAQNFAKKRDEKPKEFADTVRIYPAIRLTTFQIYLNFFTVSRIEIRSR